MDKFINEFSTLMNNYTNEMLEVIKLEDVLSKKHFKKFFKFTTKQHKLKMKQFLNQYK